jgi:hypothetical protein
MNEYSWQEEVEMERERLFEKLYGTPEEIQECNNFAEFGADWGIISGCDGCKQTIECSIAYKNFYSFVG